jgi:hypothetical protein
MAYTWRSSRRRPREVGQGIGSAGPGMARLVAAWRGKSGQGEEFQGGRVGTLPCSSHGRPRKAMLGMAMPREVGRDWARHGVQQMSGADA